MKCVQLFLVSFASFILPSLARKVKCLWQSDFDMGTMVISKPGAWKLCEDISFKPNPPMGMMTPAEAFDPDPMQPPAVNNPFAFAQGFFAVISIKSAGVHIYLNGHTIEQSPEHALMQRFLAIFDLSSAPFPHGMGPHEFIGFGSDTNITGSYGVKITGPGVIGRASHHGIHGNNNTHVEISHVTFRDNEVAAVSLNWAQRVKIHNCHIMHNRQDVPVLGMFSAARFIRVYGKYLNDNFPTRTITLRGQTMTSVQVYQALIDSINAVYDAVINGVGTVDPLYKNPFGVVDGACYAFLIHGFGVAVNNQGWTMPPASQFDAKTSGSLEITNNIIENITCWTKEIPALTVNGNPHSPIIDAQGSVFQMVNTFDGSGLAVNPDGTYKGNVVSDMQLMVADALHAKIIPEGPVLQNGVNSITPELVTWATSGASQTFAYDCNGDSMHHVVKGMIMIRIEQTRGYKVQNNIIRGVKNLSLKPFTDCASHQDALQSPENYGMEEMGNLRGISVAADRGYIWKMEKAMISKNTIMDLSSANGPAVIGIDVQGDTSDVIISDNTVSLGPNPPPSAANSTYVSLRLREYVDKATVKVGKNMFTEPVLMLNQRRTLRGSQEIPSHPTFEQLTIQGRCPYARRMAN